MGNVFKNISNSTVINESVVKNCFNKITSDGDDSLANALLEVAEQIEASKNPKAGELFNSFADEVAKDNPSKTVLKTLWDGVIGQLPHINSMVSVIEKIARLF